MPVPAAGSGLDQLATLPDLAAALGIAINDVDEPRATLALELATGAVQATAGQRILQVIYDTWIADVDHLDDSLYLDLPERPVTAVASAQVGDTAVTDYTAQLSRGRIWRAYGWRSATLPYWNAPSTVTVVYTHGYAPGDQKLQLARGVTIELAKTGYSAVAGSGPAVREQIDDYSVQYAEMAASIESALDPEGALARALRRAYGRPTRSTRLVASR